MLNSIQITFASYQIFPQFWPQLFRFEIVYSGLKLSFVRFMMSKDRKLGWLTCAIYRNPAPGITPTISINGYKAYYKLFNINDKLTNNVLSGSMADGFSGSAQCLAQVPLFYQTRTGTPKCQLSEAIMFYDTTASVTRVAAEIIRSGFSNQEVLWTVSTAFFSPTAVTASISNPPTP